MSWSSSSSSPTSTSPTRLRPSPFSNSALGRLRLRPVTLFVIFAGIVLAIAPLLHPAPRAYITSYSSSVWSTGSSSSSRYIPSHIVQGTGGLPESLGIPLTLEARLSYLLSKPMLHFDQMKYPNRHGCPMNTFNRDEYFFHGGRIEGWRNFPADDIFKYREEMVQYLRDVEAKGDDLVWEDGMDDKVPMDRRRGIILTSGDGKGFERLKLSLYLLRGRLNCTLPIQLWHFPDELKDPKIREEMDKLNIELKTAKGRVNAEKSWNIKNLAFLKSEFTEFIYFDSDNIPLIDLEELFESVEYKNSGSVFWSDLNKDHPDNPIWRILGRECTDAHWPAETGQLVYNKRANNGLNLAALHLANHMMIEQGLYNFLSYGDKDLFRYAFYALGLDWQMAPRIFASAGGYQTDRGEDSDEFCGHTMLHWGLTPQSELHNPNYHQRPAFLHTILGKARDNLQASKLFSHISRPKLDGILEPRLTRTFYEWTGSCFGITLMGPDGDPNVKGSYGDGQGVWWIPMKEALLDDDLWRDLETLSEKFVAINKQHEGH